MKKIFTIFVTSLLLATISTSNAMAETYIINNGFRFFVENEKCSIVEYLEEDTDIVIPETLLGNEVRYIYFSAFSNSEITSIQFPETLRGIYMSAFENCVQLENVTIPTKCNTIGNMAFRGCTSLNSVEIKSSISVIGESVFEGCASLESVSLPNNLSEINEKAFKNCSSLKLLEIPRNVNKIADNAFEGCSNLTIVCSKDSVVQEYAESNGIDCSLYGDVNGDGKITINDVSYIQLYRLGRYEISDSRVVKRSDVNFDTEVTLRDATLIQMKLAGYDVDF